MSEYKIGKIIIMRLSMPGRPNKEYNVEKRFWVRSGKKYIKF
jgi:hypothetical protein